MSAKAPLQTLVDSYYGRISRAARLLSRCEWEADDLTQETFIRAAESWNRFAERSDVFTWLYGILLNIDRSRRRRIVRWIRCHTALTRSFDVESCVDSDQSESELVWQQVAELPPVFRQAVTMRFAEGWSYDRIADVCDCNEATARSRVSKALKRLRLKIGGLPREKTLCMLAIPRGTVTE